MNLKNNVLNIKLIIFLIFNLAISPLFGQEDDRDGLRIAFYNVENLFDTEDDPEISDEEFTPDGMRNWNDYRYREKSNRMAKVILSIGGWEAPEIVGLAEVENRKVLEDLVASPVLQKFGYDIIHYPSPDRRGIDVGILYRKEFFTSIYSENIAVKMPDDPDFATRDILYVKGFNNDNDTIHIMVCHWPSRYGGQQQSEPKRIQAAITVRHKVDSLWKDDPDSKIIIMGDFNDEWSNISLLDHLKALKEPEPDESKAQLINLMASLPVNSGSHKYRGVWSYLDQIIVSQNLIDKTGLEISDGKAHVSDQAFLLEKDEKYPGTKPWRTFLGMKHNGGFSDHLPVYIDLSYIGSGGR